MLRLKLEIIGVLLIFKSALEYLYFTNGAVDKCPDNQSVYLSEVFCCEFVRLTCHNKTV